MLLRPLSVAAFLTGRHPDLIRRWVRQGLVSAVKAPSGETLVDLRSLAQVDAQKGVRVRAA